MASEAERLSQVLASLVDARASAGASADMVGLEHEYRVMEGSAQVDFRPLIGRLALGRPNLDPGDPNAYRLRSGSMITCDGAEAEIALPPTPLTPGFATAMSARAAGEEFELAKLLHPRFRLDGCSTHISVAVDDSHTRAVAALYARTFAPAMMLMLDGPHSPGLLVRPRPGRVELGGEFVAGPRLMAAVNFAVGSVLACVSAIADPGSIPLPPMLAIEPEPARERYGWYVDRRAFGSDLYVTGRDTPLSLQTGSTTTAQRHLVQSWAAARAALHPLLNPEDAALVDAMVNGDLPLAVEAPPDPSPRATETPRPDPTAAAVLGPLRRPQFEMAPVMVTWEIAVLMLANQRQVEAAFLCLPSRTWSSFVEALGHGRLDQAMSAYLALGSRGRRLDRRSKALRVGLYDAIGPRRNLLAPEPTSDQRPRPARTSAALRRIRVRLSGGIGRAPARRTPPATMVRGRSA